MTSYRYQEERLRQADPVKPDTTDAVLAGLDHLAVAVPGPWC
ncbi:MAG TPA: hypothetical protein VF060_23400 [Trebonia sp.]